jgi:hypothetical protein
MKKHFNILAMVLVGVFAVGMTACNQGTDNGGAPVLAPSRTLIFGSAAEVKSVNIVSTEWTAVVSDTSWITIDPTSGKNGIINVDVTANDTGAERSATLTVTNANGSKSIEILQAARGELILSDAALEFTAGGETKSISVASEIAWTVNVTSAGSEWLTVSKSGDQEFSAAAIRNTGAARTATITVENGIDTKTVEVTQLADANREVFNMYIDPVVMVPNYLPENTGSFTLKMQTWDPDDSIWDGWYVNMKIITEMPSFDKKTLSIPAGTYTVAAVAAPWTLPTGIFNNSVQQYIDNALKPLQTVSSGTLTVEGDSENYTMLWDFVLANGEELHGRFDGPIHIVNPYYTGPESTFTEDQDFGTIDLAAGESIFRGDFFESGAYIWQIWMNSPTIYLPNNELDYKGNGVLLSIGQLASVMEGGGVIVPNGTYTIVESGASLPGTVLMGYGNMQGGAYIRVMENDKVTQIAPLVAGTITTTYLGGTYTFVVDGKDDVGNAIVATFIGTMTVTRR